MSYYTYICVYLIIVRFSASTGYAPMTKITIILPFTTQARILVSRHPSSHGHYENVLLCFSAQLLCWITVFLGFLLLAFFFLFFVHICMYLFTFTTRTAPFFMRTKQLIWVYFFPFCNGYIKWYKLFCSYGFFNNILLRLECGWGHE